MSKIADFEGQSRRSLADIHAELAQAMQADRRFAQRVSDAATRDEKIRYFKELARKMPESTDLTASQQAIAAECDALKAFLLEKNRKYGDSALHPRRFLSRANAVEQLKVRIDDKLNRLCNAAADEDEDVVLDLIGYLVILRVAAKLPQ